MIYCLLQNSNILSVYFFKDSSTYYHDRKGLDCFASINNSLDITLFISGISKIIKSLKKTSFKVWRERVYGRKAKHEKI